MPRTTKPPPRVVIFAGPNGAGKSTHAVAILAGLGGHDVPSDVIKRRFGRSVSNFFKLSAPLANQWALFDNSASVGALPVATQTATQLTITEATTWRRLQKLSKLV